MVVVNVLSLTVQLPNDGLSCSWHVEYRKAKLLVVSLAQLYVIIFFKQLQSIRSVDSGL